MIQCITSKVYFCYVCFKSICIHPMIRNLNIVEQLCIFHNFESIHTIGSNNQVESSTKLCEFLQQSNQKNHCGVEFVVRFSLFPTNILSIFFNLAICYMFTHASTILKAFYFLILIFCCSKVLL